MYTWAEPKRLHGGKVPLFLAVFPICKAKGQKRCNQWGALASTTSDGPAHVRLRNKKPFSVRGCTKSGRCSRSRVSDLSASHLTPKERFRKDYDAQRAEARKMLSHTSDAVVPCSGLDDVHVAHHALGLRRSTPGLRTLCARISPTNGSVKFIHPFECKVRRMWRDGKGNCGLYTTSLPKKDVSRCMHFMGSSKLWRGSNVIVQGHKGHKHS